MMKMKLKFLLSAASIAAIWNCAGHDENWNEFVKGHFSEVGGNYVKDKSNKQLTTTKGISLKESFENAYLLTQMGIAAVQKVKDKALEEIKKTANFKTVSQQLGWLIFATAYNVVYSKKESIKSWNAALEKADLENSEALAHDAEIYLKTLGLLEYINSYAKGHASEDKDFIVWNKEDLSNIVKPDANTRNNDLKKFYDNFVETLNSIKNPISTSTTTTETETTQTTQDKKKKMPPPLPSRSQAPRNENAGGQRETPPITETGQAASEVERQTTPPIEDPSFQKEIQESIAIKDKKVAEEKARYEREIAPFRDTLLLCDQLIDSLEKLCNANSEDNFNTLVFNMFNKSDGSSLKESRNFGLFYEDTKRNEKSEFLKAFVKIKEIIDLYSSKDKKDEKNDRLTDKYYKIDDKTFNQLNSPYFKKSNRKFGKLLNSLCFWEIISDFLGEIETFREECNPKKEKAKSDKTTLSERTSAVNTKKTLFEKQASNNSSYDDQKERCEARLTYFIKVKGVISKKFEELTGKRDKAILEINGLVSQADYNEKQKELNQSEYKRQQTQTNLEKLQAESKKLAEEVERLKQELKVQKEQNGVLQNKNTKLTQKVAELSSSTTSRGESLTGSQVPTPSESAPPSMMDRPPPPLSTENLPPPPPPSRSMQSVSPVPGTTENDSTERNGLFEQIRKGGFELKSTKDSEKKEPKKDLTTMLNEAMSNRYQEAHGKEGQDESEPEEDDESSDWD